MSAFVWTGTGTATWSTGSNWSVGGVAQSSPPTSTDDVFIGNGTSATNNPITLTGSTTVQSVDCTSYTGTFTHNASVTLSIGSATVGAGNNALKMVSGMVYTKGNATSSAISFISTSTTQQTIDCGGKTLGTIIFNGAGGSWQLTSIFASAGLITLTAGALAGNGQTVNCTAFNSTNTNTRTLDITNCTFNLSSTGTIWNTQTTTGLTLTTTGSTIKINDTSSTSKTFGAGTSTTWNNVLITPGGSGTVTFSSSATYNKHDLTVAGTKNIIYTQGQTKTFTGGAKAFWGTANKDNMVTITSGSPGTQYTTSSATTLICDGLNLTDNKGAGAGIPFYAGINSVNTSNNSNWTFTGPPGMLLVL